MAAPLRAMFRSEFGGYGVESECSNSAMWSSKLQLEGSESCTKLESPLTTKDGEQDASEAALQTRWPDTRLAASGMQRCSFWKARNARNPLSSRRRETDIKEDQC